MPGEFVRLVVDSTLQRNTNPTRYSSEWGEILLMEGFLSAWRCSGEDRYLEYVRTWLDYHIGQSFKVNRGQPCPTSWGPIVPAMTLFEETGQESYVKLAEEACNYICYQADRLKSGALQHYEGSYQVWVDTLYYTSPPLAKMGTTGQCRGYLDEAARQIVAFAHHLQCPMSGLFYHMYDEKTGTQSPCFWGRGNGWAMMAIVDTLKNLPMNHPLRDDILAILEGQLGGVLETQDCSGAWHTVLDRHDSYRETSATSMLIYGISKAMRNGWQQERCLRAVRNGWRALVKRVTREGHVVGVSGLTPPGNFDHYQSIPLGEYAWGTGSFLKTAGEYLRWT